MRESFIVVVLAVGICSQAAAETIQGSDFGYGNWRGSAYSFDDTGTFSHCVVSASFNSGDRLYLSVNADATVSVGVESPGLKLQTGDTIPVTLRIDRRAPLFGAAEAMNDTFAILKLPQFDTAMNALQRGRMLIVESSIGTASYDLTGTNRALDAAMNCAANNLDYSSSPSVVSRPQENSGSTDKTILFQVATGIISDLGLSDFRYFTEAESKEFLDSNGVFWSSEQAGIFGGVLTVQTNTEESLKVSDANDIAFMGRDCVGEVATASRNLDVPDTDAREIRALCVTNGSTVESLLTKVRVGKEVFYTLLVFNADAKIEGQEARRTISEGTTLKAVSYIREQGSASD